MQYAIVETDGTLSVLLKKENQPATKSELKINTPKSSLPCIVISDGRIIKTDFAECNTDSDKIKAILKDKHLNEEDVMLMTLDKDGNINILKRTRKNEKTDNCRMYARYGNSDFDRRVRKSEKYLPQYELLGKRGHKSGGKR